MDSRVDWSVDFSTHRRSLKIKKTLRDLTRVCLEPTATVIRPVLIVAMSLWTRVGRHSPLWPNKPSLKPAKWNEPRSSQASSTGFVKSAAVHQKPRDASRCSKKVQSASTMSSTSSPSWENNCLWAHWCALFGESQLSATSLGTSIRHSCWTHATTRHHLTARAQMTVTLPWSKKRTSIARLPKQNKLWQGTKLQAIWRDWLKGFSGLKKRQRHRPVSSTLVNRWSQPYSREASHKRGRKTMVTRHKYQ